MSGIGDAFEKVKKAATENSEKVAEGVGKAAEYAKEKTGGKYDDKIDKAGGAATEYLRKQAAKKRDADGGKDA
ncbi:antitoxin [Nocardiopsis potens]|uniref:antitoxin n=1 Tax=Nocardiopsis potens TaxID=1246458 RepID=UPI0003452042|nr:antitoxin [Nocardiopsis potens]